jgi:RNA polymerase sigma factor (sigma-70 family)
LKYEISSSDTDLIAGCLDGQEAAWEALISKYERLIYAICRRYNLQQAESDDIFGRVCLLLLQNLETLRDRTRLAAWLITTSSRECWHYKKSLATAALPEGHNSFELLEANIPGDSAPLPEEELLRLERQQRVREGLRQLAPRCQKLLWYLFYDPTEPSYTRIAAELNMPVASIGPNRTRCLEKLKKQLQEEPD